MLRSYEHILRTEGGNAIKQKMKMEVRDEWQKKSQE